MADGKPHATWGAQAISETFGVPLDSAELLYSVPSLAGGAKTLAQGSKVAGKPVINSAKNYSAKIPEEANANSKLPSVGQTKGYENKDYSKDVANLGGERNKGLNERISNRQKDFYLNEQNLNKEAKELAKNIKLPISDKVLENHIINGEPKGNFFKGGHTTLGNVKVEKVVKEYANGVYEAKISIPNPRALKDPNAKPFLEKSGKEKDSVSTMFPRTWTQDRLRVELEHAFKNASKVPSTKSEWKGVTKSGVEVRWYVKENGKIDTIYPKPPSYN